MVYDDAAALSRAAGLAFVGCAQRAVADTGRFVVALAGGTTPRLLYRLLATEFRLDVPWQDVHLFWSDERYVSPDDSASNFGMVRRTLLDDVPIPDDNIHPVDTSIVDPDEAARRYEQDLRLVLTSRQPRFDWMLLGLGDDGHVASLFPGSALLDEASRLVRAVTDSPKPPPVRITMTLPLICASREVHVLVSGRNKGDALLRSLEPGDALPSQLVSAGSANSSWWVDRDAAGSQLGRETR